MILMDGTDGVVIKMANFFLNILDCFKHRLSKWRTFFELSKWRIFFLSKWRTFSDLSKWRTFALSKWRTFFMKMANFFLSKWRISFNDNSQNGEFFAVVMKCLKGLTQKSRLFAEIQNSRLLHSKKYTF